MPYKPGIGTERRNSLMTRLAVITLFLLMTLIPVPTVTTAQQAPLQYAVKFVCGKSDGDVVAPGQYFTAINVHNPTEKAISFLKKFAVALPGERPGPVSPFFGARLGGDQALEIDCSDIFERVPARADFVKGFVIIESDVELDVVAVYTAAGATGAVETLDIERISPRRRTADRPDLVVRSIDKVEFVPGSLNLRITLRVANMGSANAGTSLTRIKTDNGVPIDVATPALGAGDSVMLTTTVTQNQNCFDPDCTVCGTADATNLVGESDETNNKTCETIPG
ncbi:MAG: hypothetical protein D6723_03645 [Acidobacteria bacterium]|nr:MAG: hypothetical protein D6723_03645 [Acidobacteriota bacterium]